MSDSAVPEKKFRRENLLFHSRIEICRIMQLLGWNQSRISAELKDGNLFESRILYTDRKADHFFIANCAHDSINAMLLNSPSVEFTATDKQGLLFTFVATNPVEALLDGERCVQFTLPATLLLHNRREHPHILVPADISLRCVADEAGFIPFETQITDISHDGLGCLIYGPGISLETGTILKGCRIITPNGKTVVADMELRNAAPFRLPDGTMVNRAGFHFIKRPEKISELVDLFIQDLDKKQDLPQL
jgi:c-di-GMP-binding flagellar brake protein YcgR